GNWQPYALGNPRSYQFIRQDSNMLGVILKLDDVVVPIVGKHEMALSAPAHRAQMLFDLDHRRRMIPRNPRLFGAGKLRSIAFDEVFHAAHVHGGEIDHWSSLLDELHGFLELPSHGTQEGQRHHGSAVNSGSTVDEDLSLRVLKRFEGEVHSTLKQFPGLELKVVVSGIPENMDAVGYAQMASIFSGIPLDRKSTRLNSSHRTISYAVFCLTTCRSEYDTISLHDALPI